MSSGNFERMIRLAEEVFATKNDPNQLDVNQAVIERLQRIHPSTVTEYNAEDGPVAWVLIFPTTQELMRRFLEKEISEKELFEQTQPGAKYEAIYLCSALVLEEHRRKGIVKRLAVSAIENIRRDHPVKSLFVWPFSDAGQATAEKISQLTGLSLYS